MSAICPAGPPNDVNPILVQTLRASEKLGAGCSDFSVIGCPRRKSPFAPDNQNRVHGDAARRRALITTVLEKDCNNNGVLRQLAAVAYLPC